MFRVAEIPTDRAPTCTRERDRDREITGPESRVRPTILARDHDARIEHSNDALPAAAARTARRPPRTRSGPTVNRDRHAEVDSAEGGRVAEADRLPARGPSA
jgi:hypothetical protein